MRRIWKKKVEKRCKKKSICLELSAIKAGRRLEAFIRALLIFQIAVGQRSCPNQISDLELELMFDLNQRSFERLKHAKRVPSLPC